MIIDRDYHTDTVMLRNERTFEVITVRSRKDGKFIWKASDRKIQKTINEWSKGSTVGAIACLLEKQF